MVGYSAPTWGWVKKSIFRDVMVFGEEDSDGDDDSVLMCWQTTWRVKFAWEGKHEIPILRTDKNIEVKDR